jgi:hypothetical protein
MNHTNFSKNNKKIDFNANMSEVSEYLTENETT